MRKHPGSNVLRRSIRHDKLRLNAAGTEEIDLSQSLFALLVRPFDQVIGCFHRPHSPPPSASQHGIELCALWPLVGNSGMAEIGRKAARPLLGRQMALADVA